MNLPHLRLWLTRPLETEAILPCRWSGLFLELLIPEHGPAWRGPVHRSGMSNYMKLHERKAGQCPDAFVSFRDTGWRFLYRLSLCCWPLAAPSTTGRLRQVPPHRTRSRRNPSTSASPPVDRRQCGVRQAVAQRHGSRPRGNQRRGRGEGTVPAVCFRGHPKRSQANFGRGPEICGRLQDCGRHRQFQFSGVDGGVPHLSAGGAGSAGYHQFASGFHQNRRIHLEQFVQPEG